MQTLRLPILLFFLCGLCLPALALQSSGRTWKDRNGVERTRAELDKILADHEKYIDSLSKEDKKGKRADLSNAKLQGTDLQGADLSFANLQGARLFGADLQGAKLQEADLQGADMTNVRGLPDITRLAFARGLSTISFRPNNIPTFVAWKKALQEAGYTRASKDLVAAIRRNDEPELWETILFDWTCEFGANPLRPLTVLLWLWVAGTTAYAVGLARRSGSGLYLLATGEKIPAGNRRNRVRRMRWEMPRHGTGWKFPFRFARYARRALGTAALFSMMSAFNIGFREVNLGRWIRLMQPREFDIKARGWLRVVSGLQSLTSVYLLALAILSHFGTPFDF